MKLKTSLRGIAKSKQLLLGITLILNFIFFGLSYLGIGFPIGNYMFNQVGVMDDLETGILLSGIFYNSALLDVPGFSWIVSPLVNLLHLSINKIIVSTSQQLGLCQILQFEAPCQLANHFRLSQGFFLIPDYVLVSWIVLIPFTLFVVLRNLSGSSFSAALLTLSYPVLYAISRGNPDLVITLLIALFLLNLRRKKVLICYSLISIMAAIKLPLLVLLIPLSIIFPRVKYLVFSLSLTLMFYLIPILAFGNNGTPISQLRVFNSLVSRYNNTYALGDAGLMHSTSLNTFAKTTIYLFNITAISGFLFYLFLLFALLLILLVFSKSILMNLDRVKNVGIDNYETLFLIFILLIILVPGVSQDYRLSYLVPFVATSYKLKNKDVDWTFLVLSALLLSKNFVHITFENNDWGTTIGALLNPIALTILLFLELNRIKRFLTLL